jgi:tetratricopeptide (TPR) repeat protein
LSARNYPRNWGPHNQLSVTYIDMGQFEEGLKEGQESARLEPHVEPPWRRQLDALMCLNRLPEAEAMAAKVPALGPDGSRIHQRFLELAYLEDDRPSIAREIQWFSGKPEEYLSFGLQAAWLNMHGQRRESSEEYQRAAEAARRQGFGYVADDLEEADARADALAGNCQSARRLGSPALALAMCDETAEAEKLAAETSKQFPNGIIWNAVELPEIEAMIEPAKGVQLLASASPYERAYPDAVYVRGLVFLQMKRARKRRRNSGRSRIMRAPVGEPPGFTRTGDSTTRCLIWAWHAATCLRARALKPGMRTKSSSRYGKTPTPIFPSLGRLRRSTRSCSEKGSEPERARDIPGSVISNWTYTSLSALSPMRASSQVQFEKVLWPVIDIPGCSPSIH